MIIENLMEVIVTIFGYVIGLFNIPQINAETLQLVNNQITEIIEIGSGFANLLLPMNIVKVFLGIVVLVEVGIDLYHFLMWVIKKIPLASVS